MFFFIKRKKKRVLKICIPHKWPWSSTISQNSNRLSLDQGIFSLTKIQDYNNALIQYLCADMSSKSLKTNTAMKEHERNTYEKMTSSGWMSTMAVINKIPCVQWQWYIHIRNACRWYFDSKQKREIDREESNKKQNHFVFRMVINFR